MSQDKGRVLFTAGTLTRLGANLFNETLKFRAEGYLHDRCAELAITL